MINTNDVMSLASEGGVQNVNINGLEKLIEPYIKIWCIEELL